MNSKKAAKGPKVEKDTAVEDALQALSKANAKTAIVTDNGETVGSVDLDQMIAAIARPAKEEGKAETIYR